MGNDVVLLPTSYFASELDSRFRATKQQQRQFGLEPIMTTADGGFGDRTYVTSFKKRVMQTTCVDEKSFV